MKIWTALLAITLVAASVDAEASRRMGGGKSVGKQSGNVTQREAAPQAPAGPAAQPGGTTAQQAPAAAQRPAAATPPQAAAPKRPWAGILGGLAAGLGLAWLAHSLGFGEAFAQFLMFGLLALVIMVVVGLVLRARRNAAQGGAGRSPYALQGAGAPADLATEPAQYNPSKVGNDASARPWESTSTHFEGAAPAASPVGGIRIGAGLGGAAAANWSIPADFDVAGFVDAAKRNFIALQDAWDRSDIPALRVMMTDDMVSEIRTQLAEREAHRGAGPNQTDVVMLEAQLLGIEDLGDGYMASVEFSGMIREEPSAGPSPFREVWNMTKPKDGRSGWLVAGVQALQ
jgi:predicted lipid-binding transport protein (Tim44 family)